jgi:hypothetical protein
LKEASSPRSALKTMHVCPVTFPTQTSALAAAAHFDGHPPSFADVIDTVVGLAVGAIDWLRSRVEGTRTDHFMI